MCAATENTAAKERVVNLTTSESSGGRRGNFFDLVYKSQKAFLQFPSVFDEYDAKRLLRAAKQKKLWQYTRAFL
jgi:hypothetical protein